MNKVTLIGNLSKDPLLTTTNNGKNVCKFSIAVNRRFTDADGKKIADFHNIVVWGKTGENCHKYLKKGKKCAIVGEIQNRSWTAEDGSNRHATEIIAEEVEFLSPIGDGMSESSSKSATSQEAPNKSELEPVEDDSLPF